MSIVLVTGGSGFVGSHTILQLLAAGHTVRTTVRSMARERELRTTLTRAGASTDSAYRLSFVVANLEVDSGWSQAAAGCDFVLHIASPIPAEMPKNPDDLIVPAREGVLRVLRAARDGGVTRVVVTSSFAAIGYGHGARQTSFTEADWTNLDARLTPYVKSKTLAERAAWDFIAKEGNGLELAVVNPVAIFGPVLGPDFSPSIDLVQRLMNRDIGGCPRLSFGVVDVRDVADLHIRAMTHPAAKNERFLAAAGDFVSILDVAKILKARLGSSARRVPARQLPDLLVRIAALRDPMLRQILPELGKIKNGSNEKAKRVLGWTPRSNDDAIAATAESLRHFGLLKRSGKRKRRPKKS